MSERGSAASRNKENLMSISPIGTPPSPQRPASIPVQPKTNDHDADDGVASTPAPSTSPAQPAPGTGTTVDKRA